MKILGIGVDIVENKRLKNSIKNKSFISRLFTLLEIKNSRLVKDKSIPAIFISGPILWTVNCCIGLLAIKTF